LVGATGPQVSIP